MYMCVYTYNRIYVFTYSIYTHKVVKYFKNGIFIKTYFIYKEKHRNTFVEYIYIYFTTL